MTAPFPQAMDFIGHNAPSRVEAEIYDLVIEGTLPEDIQGSYYQTVPDPQFPPKLGWDTFLSGDGMVRMFRFENGHVDFKQRYVRTERWQLERQARRALYGAYRNPFTDDPSVQGKGRGVANTTPVFHGGRLFALKEDSRPWEVDPNTLPPPKPEEIRVVKTNWFDLFKYPRSLLVSWLGNAGAQTGVYGVALWAPALFVLLLKVTPQEAAKMMLLLTVVGFLGRLSFSWLSEKIGRRNCGGLLGFGAGILIILAGYNYMDMIFGLSAFWLILAAAMFFADGGFAIVGPYAAEIWPSHLKTTGMGSAYGFGGIGKIIGPVGLALIVGSGNYLKPDVPLPEIPVAFVYLGCWFLMAGIVYYFFGIETKGKSLEQIDKELATASATTLERDGLGHVDTLVRRTER